MVREKESTKGIEFHEIKMNEFIISDKRLVLVWVYNKE